MVLSRFFSIKRTALIEAKPMQRKKVYFLLLLRFSKLISTMENTYGFSLNGTEENCEDVVFG